jgi:ABC-type polysaccharide/polyol phosphate export permease
MVVYSLYAHLSIYVLLLLVCKFYLLLCARCLHRALNTHYRPTSVVTGVTSQVLYTLTGITHFGAVLQLGERSLSCSLTSRVLR